MSHTDIQLKAIIDDLAASPNEKEIARRMLDRRQSTATGRGEPICDVAAPKTYYRGPFRYSTCTSFNYTTYTIKIDMS